MNIEKPRRLRGTRRGTICAMLAVALVNVACSKEEPPKIAPPAVVQPAAPPESKAGEIRTETSAPAPMPKTDANKELSGQVESALHRTPGLEALAVDVVASDGVVTLFGTADSHDNVEQAGKVASGVPGVKSVQNKIVVVRGS
jgi:hyperosmotically inducible protein